VVIESAPGRKADHESDHLVAIEVLARPGGWCGQRRANSDNDSDNRKQSFVHGSNFLSGRMEIEGHYSKRPPIVNRSKRSELSLTRARRPCIKPILMDKNFL